MLGRQALTFTTGPIARVGPNTLVTSSPDLVMRMSAARSLYSKADVCGQQNTAGQDNIFSQQDEEKHTRRRAQMADGVRNQYVSSSVHFTYRS
jgi:cytochrome P450